MRKIILAVALVALVSVFVGLAANSATKREMRATMQKMHTKSELSLKMAMRKLWEDHITWTRCYIVSSLAGLGDVHDVAGRLMRNQQDIGDALKPYYGDAAGDKLAQLLKDHISIATEVVAAAKANKTADLAQAQAKWRSNADDLAIFLSNANPNWSKTELADMLYKHLDYTSSEVNSRLKREWSADIAAYDKGHAHMMMWSDVLSDGIIKQFPERFILTTASSE